MPAKPNEELTSARRAVLVAYREHIEEHGQAPSLRELAAVVDQTHPTVRYHLGILREQGYITNTAPKVTVIRPRLTAKGKRA